MFGAVIGDLIGSPFVSEQGGISKDFPLLSEKSHITGVSFQTAAVADALLSFEYELCRPENLEQAVIHALTVWCGGNRDAGYGSGFARWLDTLPPRPYSSSGSGCAARISAAGWLFGSLTRTREVARIAAAVTHNTTDGMEGAEAVASAVYLARVGSDQDAIRKYLSVTFSYDLSRTLEEFRSTANLGQTCRDTVPAALLAFLEGTDFEDAVRNAVSLGGNTAALAAITGSVAEAFWGIPQPLLEELRARIPYEEMIRTLQAVDSLTIQRFGALEGKRCRDLDRIMHALDRGSSMNDYYDAALAFDNSLRYDECIILPLPDRGFRSGDDPPAQAGFLRPERFRDPEEGITLVAAFTSPDEFRGCEDCPSYGHCGKLVLSLADAYRIVLGLENADGIILNPFTSSVTEETDSMKYNLGVYDVNHSHYPEDYLDDDDEEEEEEEEETPEEREHRERLYGAHERSINNRLILDHVHTAGCFHCCRIFHPREIKQWIVREDTGEGNGTALCPYCGVDSVIPEDGLYPLTEEFLEDMRDFWF